MAEEQTDSSKEFAEQCVQSAVLGNVVQMQSTANHTHIAVQEILSAYAMKVCELISKCDTIDEVHEVIGMGQIEGVMTEFAARK